MNQLKLALDFALNFHESGRKLVFQTTDNGKYCIGWGEEKGWEKYQFDFDTEIVSKIIIQFLNKQSTDSDSPYYYMDGGTSNGFLMKSIPETFSDEYEGIKNPFYGIVSFEPYVNYYSK